MLKDQPDPNRAAPRPGRRADHEAAGPDMDHPPRARAHDKPSFDQATQAADRAARSAAPPDTVNPTPPDTGRENERPTLRRARDAGSR
ncbi:hypothetical protein [Bordetella sp. 2513F-2]